MKRAAAFNIDSRLLDALDSLCSRLNAGRSEIVEDALERYIMELEEEGLEPNGSGCRDRAVEFDGGVLYSLRCRGLRASYRIESDSDYMDEMVLDHIHRAVEGALKKIYRLRMRVKGVKLEVHIYLDDLDDEHES